jgi:DNA-binding MarR family transcriptional regulator
MTQVIDEQLGFLLYVASRAMTQAYAPLLDPLGITYPQYLVLLVLWERGDLSCRSIGQRLQLDSGTLTPLLKRLAAQGLVTRRRDPSDERVVRISLTPAGEALRARVKDIPERIACRTRLDDGTAALLRRDLAQLREALRAAPGLLGELSIAPPAAVAERDFEPAAEAAPRPRAARAPRRRGGRSPRARPVS